MKKDFTRCLNEIEKAILASNLAEDVRERFLDEVMAYLMRSWKHLRGDLSTDVFLEQLSEFGAEAAHFATTMMKVVHPTIAPKVGLYEFRAYLKWGDPDIHRAPPNTWAHEVAITYLSLPHPTVELAAVEADLSRGARLMPNVAQALLRRFWREIREVRRVLGNNRVEQLRRCEELAQELDLFDGVILRNDSGKRVLVTGAIVRMLFAIG